jgi:hypothetical protein
MAGTLWPREAAGHHPTGGLLGDLVRIAAGRRPATGPSPRRSCRESAIGLASLRPSSADRRQATDRFRNTLVRVKPPYRRSVLPWGPRTLRTPTAIARLTVKVSKRCFAGRAEPAHWPAGARLSVPPGAWSRRLRVLRWPVSGGRERVGTSRLHPAIMLPLPGVRSRPSAGAERRPGAPYPPTWH